MICISILLLRIAGIVEFEQLTFNITIIIIIIIIIIIVSGTNLRRLRFLQASG